MSIRAALTATLALPVLVSAIDSQWLQSSYQGGENPPGWQEGDSGNQTVFLAGQEDITGTSQLDHCQTIFIGSAAVDGTPDEGWKQLPNVVGFDLQRLPLEGYGDAVLPYFVERGKDAANIKRVVIAQPGKPRDAWKYVNLLRNSLICAAAADQDPVNMDEILLAAPVWLNDYDQKAGAVGATDVYFKSSRWFEGGMSSGPGDTEISSVTAMDFLVAHFLDASAFPAVEQVVSAGHSMGAQFTQRYALMRDADDKDDKLRYWVGNPGSFAWLTEDRPKEINSDCSDSYNSWPYGGLTTHALHPFPSTFKKEFKNNWDGVVERYRARYIRHAQGLADNGPGDTHCEAQAQGATHLERGQGFESMLNAMSGGMPGRTKFDYIEGVSHQDYPMMAAEVSQTRIFREVNGQDDSDSGVDPAAAGAGGTSSKNGTAESRENGAEGLSVALKGLGVALFAVGAMVV
ncbi:hypothetical protein K525DRAFT_197250 [Schizophyllum commune Loenen D]|nr:hypothetical protein K525DRAFT_197250 [Schizophyllum commune Loenen D]